MISTWFTARILSPTWRRPQRSAGEPGNTKYFNSLFVPQSCNRSSALLCNLTPPPSPSLNPSPLTEVKGCLTWDNSANSRAGSADAGDDDEAKSFILQPGDGDIIRISRRHPWNLVGISVGLLRLSPPHCEGHLPPLCGLAHHAHHHVVTRTQHRLAVHGDYLVTGEQPAVQVRRSPRYYVADGDLIGRLVKMTQLTVLTRPLPEIPPPSRPLSGSRSLTRV